MIWIDIFYEEDIFKCMEKARNKDKFPGGIWLGKNGVAIDEYLGRFYFAEGGSLSGGKDGDLFEGKSYCLKGTITENPKYGVIGITSAVISTNMDGHVGISLKVHECYTNVTDWYGRREWEKIIRTRRVKLSNNP